MALTAAQIKTLINDNVTTRTAPSSVTRANVAQILNELADNITFVKNGDNAYYITGSVGIGTGAPDWPLHIRKLSASIFVESTDTGNPQAIFAASSGTTYAGSQSNHSFELMSAGVTRMTILANGRVLISKSSDSGEAFQVGASARFESTQHSLLLKNIASTVGGDWRLAQGWAGNYDGSFVVMKGSAPALVMETTNNHLFNILGGFRSKAGALYACSDHANGFLKFALGTGGAGTGWDTVLQSWDTLQLATGTAQPIVFKINNTEKARLSSAGNLLIGRPDDFGNAVINLYKSTDADTYILISNSSAKQVGWGLAGSGGNGFAGTFSGTDFDLRTANLPRMTLTASGNVMIGTTVDSGNKLRVVGTVRVDDDVEISDSAKGVLLKSPDGNKWRVQVTNAGILTATAI